MDQLYQLSLNLTIWLQENYPQFLSLMRLISLTGEEQFYLVILPAFYWAINKHLGRQLGYLFLFSVAVNNILKNTFRQPRPFWLDPSVQQAEAEGYGITSGHVQNATAVLFLLASWVKRGWVWLPAALYVFLMAVSRVYLGVHFIQDVFFGFWVGLLLLVIFLVLRNRFIAGFNKRILGKRLLGMIALPVILASTYVAVLLLLGPPDMTVPWSAYIPAAELNGYEDIVSGVAGLLGFGIGIVLESSRIRFRSDGPVWQRIARYLLGIAVAIAIWGGLRAAFPFELAWIALPFRFLRYFLLLFWVTYLAPWVFVKLRLATTDPEPEARVTL
jgi:membrane-associated phospholipid phosphatase